MTDSEALKYFKDANRTNYMVCVFPKSDIGKCVMHALEKQIPKKPVDKSKNPVDWHVMACPCCNNTFWNSGQFIRYQPKFCNYCGQAIDWSES